MTAVAGRVATIDVVIVNWNAGEHLAACLESIARSQPGRFQVTCVRVIDNASTDDSLGGVDKLGLPLEVVRNPSNVGFAVACNQGAAGSSADYLLFLNPDTRLFADTLATVTEFMDGRRATGVGICGARVLGPDGRDTISCARFPSPRVLLGKIMWLDRWLPRVFPPHHLSPEETRESRPVDQVIGAFFFVRRPLFDELGGFDERYFMYFEEVDFALRARRRGWGSYLLAPARVVHIGNVSSDQVRGRRLEYSLRSRLLFAYRHWPHGPAHALVASTFTVELVARLVQALRRGGSSELCETAAAYARVAFDRAGWSAVVRCGRQRHRQTCPEMRASAAPRLKRFP